MVETVKTLFTLVQLALVINGNESFNHRNETYVNILSRSAIKVIEEVDRECVLTCISIKTSNSQESARQHNDIINDIAGGVDNGMSIISSDDSTFTIGQFKEQKRFNILVVDGLNGFRLIIYL